MNYAAIKSEAQYIAQMFIAEINQMKTDGLWNTWNADGLRLRQVRDLCDHKWVNGAAAYKFLSAVKAASVSTFVPAEDKLKAERLLEDAETEISCQPVQPSDLDDHVTLTAQLVLHYMVIDAQFKLEEAA